MLGKIHKNQAIGDWPKRGKNEKNEECFPFYSYGCG
jgi:hypothetical protein